MNVFYLPINFDDSAASEIYACLSEKRRTRADACRVSGERRRSLGAGLLLEYIRSVFHIDAPLVYSPEGKPSFSGDAIFFNLSHSADCVMAAVGKAPLGVDLEYLRDTNYHSLAGRFFSPEEQKTLSVSQTPQDTFFTLWTQKEAVMKANGKGFGLPMPSFTVTDGHVSLGGICYTVDTVEAPRGYRAAIAYQGKREAHGIKYLASQEILCILKERGKDQ